MKKFIIFLVIVLIAIAGVSYLYLSYKANFYDAKLQNMGYENYLNKEIYGGVLASLINKAVDNNIQNDVEKDNNGIYMNNNTNSINIDIKILDTDKTYNMEILYNGGMDQFVRYYNQIKFKCTQIDYHQSTGKVKYMLFEQISK